MTEAEGVESWVQCDRCNKWRRVPKNVADALDEDAPWYAPDERGGRAKTPHTQHRARSTLHNTHSRPSLSPSSSHPNRYCEHNPLKQFASCKVAQELTDEEIDQEMHEASVGGARAVVGRHSPPRCMRRSSPRLRTPLSLLTR
jgi:hypothetical protein